MQMVSYMYSQYYSVYSVILCLRPIFANYSRPVCLIQVSCKKLIMMVMVRLTIENLPGKSECVLDMLEQSILVCMYILVYIYIVGCLYNYQNVRPKITILICLSCLNSLYILYIQILETSAIEYAAKETICQCYNKSATIIKSDLKIQYIS